MKLIKKIATFVVTICTLFAFVATVSKVSAEDNTITIKYNDTFTPAFGETGATSDTEHTDETAGLTFKEQGIYKKSTYTYLMFGANKGFMYNTESLGTIKSIAITYSSGVSTSAKIGVYFGNSVVSDYTTSSNKTIAGKSQTDTFTNSTAGYGYFQISTSNKNTQITQIVITYEATASNVPTLSITADSANAMVGGANINFAFNASNIADTSNISWKSSDESVATIDQNGVLTAKAMGTTTLSASINDVTSNEVNVTVYPNNSNPISIAEALQVCELTGNQNAPYSYTVEGTIESVDTAYDSGYDNITVTITDSVNSIKVFRLAGGANLEVGHDIKVTGYLLNYSGTTKEFAAGATYELVIDDSLNAFIESLNSVNSFMSMGFKYTEKVQKVEASNETDVLNHNLVGVSGTAYKDWSAIKSESTAIYAGNSAGGTNNTGDVVIQLRSNNSNSGIVSTTSGGKATKVVVTWNTNTSTGRTLNIYGSNEPYSAASDLYSTNTQGTKIGSIVYGTSTELTIEGDYAYIGIRSNSGALYLDEVQISWAGEDYDEYSYSDVDFRFRCGVDSSLATLEGAEYTYGLEVRCGDKTQKFASAELTPEDSKLYTVIKLGDILNNTSRITDEFTVVAYVEVDGQTYYSELTKTYSVKTIVAEYLNSYDIEEVEQLAAALAHVGIVVE